MNLAELIVQTGAERLKSARYIVRVGNESFLRDCNPIISPSKMYCLFANKDFDWWVACNQVEIIEDITPEKPCVRNGNL